MKNQFKQQSASRDIAPGSGESGRRQPAYQHGEVIDLREEALPLPAGPISRLKSSLRSEALYPMDIFCLAYLGFMLLMLVCYRQNVAGWGGHVFNFSLLATAIGFILFTHNRFPEQLFIRLARLIYPVAVLAFSWNTLTELAAMIYGSYWTTAWIIDIDRLLLGAHPTIWFEQFHRPWLNELMNVFYSGYYLFTPAVVLTLVFRGEHRRLAYALSLVSFTYLGNFIFFYLLPTIGPQMTPEIIALSGSAGDGYWAAAFTRWVQDGGAAVGGAFPSSHVSGALIWALVTIRLHRPAGLFLALLVPGIAVSTVYLGYHHAMDPLAGVLWGLLAWRLVEPRCRYLLR